MTIESQNYVGLNSPDPKMRYQTVCDLISVGADKDRYLLVDLLDDPADKVRGASRFGYAATGVYPDKIPALDLVETAVKGLAWWLDAYYVANENSEELISPNLPSCVQIALQQAGRAGLLVSEFSSGTFNSGWFTTPTPTYVCGMSRYNILDSSRMRSLALLCAQIYPEAAIAAATDDSSPDIEYSQKSEEVVEGMVNRWFSPQWGSLDDLIGPDGEELDEWPLPDWVEWEGSVFQYHVYQFLQEMQAEAGPSEWTVTETMVAVALRSRDRAAFTELAQTIEQECSKVFATLDVKLSARGAAGDLSGR